MSSQEQLGRPARVPTLALAVLLAAALVGCQGQTTTEAPIVPIRNMHELPRYDAQERSTYFADHRTMRPLVQGTVSREMAVDPTIDQGLDDSGAYVTVIPDEVSVGACATDETPRCTTSASCGRGRACVNDYCVTAQETCQAPGDCSGEAECRGGRAALLTRGQERFGIYCAPCHGGLGDGEGMVPNVSGVATIRPPTFHSDVLRHIPDGQLYATIRNGKGFMPAYAHNTSVHDRWAIVAYVRALQLSQMDQRTASLPRAPEANR